MAEVEHTDAPLSGTVPWSLFESVLAPRLEAGEDLESVMRLGQVLGAQRARVHERDLMVVDVEFVFALLCWWPFKALVEQALLNRVVRLRGDLLARVKSGGRVMEGGLLSALDEVLALPYEQMLARQSDGRLAPMIQRLQSGNLEPHGQVTPN